MDVKLFLSVSVELAPFVLAVVIGLTTYAGKLGVSGKAQLVVALALGLVFGGGFLVALAGVPTTFAGWFLVVLYGLLTGLTASGIYETGKGLAVDAGEQMRPLTITKGPGSGRK